MNYIKFYMLGFEVNGRTEQTLVEIAKQIPKVTVIELLMLNMDKKIYVVTENIQAMRAMGEAEVLNLTSKIAKPEKHITLIEPSGGRQ